MQTLPYTGSLSASGSIDISGRGARTLYAWGDFAGGKLSVQAVIPHPDGDEVFDIDEEGAYSVQDEPEAIEPDAAPQADSVLELTGRGFISFDLRAPVVRISLLDCDADPDVKFWIG